MDGTTTDKQPLYHVLYADEVRLDSLDAQINKRVPIRFIQGAGASTGNTTSGEAGVPSIAKGIVQASETKSTSTSTEYSFRDASYFSTLEALSIDLKNSSPTLSIQPDGKIHAFRGKIKVVSPASYSQLSSSAEFQIEIETAALNGKVPGIIASAEKSLIQKRLQELRKFRQFFKTGEKRPVVPQFLLTLNGNKTIYGPLNESFFRLRFIDLVMTFGISLPFEWIVVGYLYPYSLVSYTEAEDVLEQHVEDMGVLGLAPSFDALRERFSPKSDAIMIPLLILR